MSLRRVLLVLPLAALLLGGTARAQAPVLPANDLERLLALTGGQVVQPFGPATRAPAPPLRAVPRAGCDAASRPLAGMQGRVTAADIASPAAKDGWTCNLEPVGGYPTPGGFRTWRYTDRAGHVCAFYDTSLGSPATIVSALAGPSAGVAVLDMSDPAHPVRTTMLTTAAMLAPHESLNLDARRGLLAAEVGNGLTLPGSMAIYDVGGDCRRPVLQAELPTPYGHESGFSPDGNTFWVAGGAGEVQAIDVTNPKLPHVVWRGAMYAHGLSLSADGRTLFQTDPINGTLGLLDVSEVQDRRPAPVVRQISRVTWDTVSIPQNTVPLTIGGHPYLLEFDEFAFRFNPATVDDRAGAARILDIADPAHPTVLADLRLEVNMRDAHREAAGDPSPFPGPTSYGAHYCAVPRQTDPGIVACSFINSGLRVFDIRDPSRPREVAYYVAPPKAGTAAGLLPGDAALSQPAFDAARREVWYTDAVSGLHVLRLAPAAWPADPSCVPRGVVTITLPRSLRSARATYAGRHARAVRRGGRLRVRVDLRRLTAATVRVRVRGRRRDGRAVTLTRRLATCRARA